MATIICKKCLRELDETMFKMHRSGHRNGTCRECVGAKMQETRRRTREAVEEGIKRRAVMRNFDWLYEHTEAELLSSLAKRGFVGVVEKDGRKYNLSNLTF